MTTKLEKAAQKLAQAQAKEAEAIAKFDKLVLNKAAAKAIAKAEAAAQAAAKKTDEAAIELQAAQAAHEAAAAASAQELKAAAAAEAKKIKPAFVYIERVRIRKKEMQSISRKFDVLCEIYGDTLKGVKFTNFLQYMKKRHNIAADDKSTPKRGWSDFYAVQFAEKYATEAAKDMQHEAHSAARAYLLNDKLKAQAEAAAEADYLARTK